MLVPGGGESRSGLVPVFVLELLHQFAFMNLLRQRSVEHQAHFRISQTERPQ